MATLSKTRVNSNYVFNFHNDAYNMEADIHDFQYLCVFLVYKIKAYAKTKHLERNYPISNWTGEKENKYRGICFLANEKTLRMHRAGGVGSDDTFDFRAWRKTNPCFSLVKSPLPIYILRVAPPSLSLSLASKAAPPLYILRVAPPLSLSSKVAPPLYILRVAPPRARRPSPFSTNC